MVARSVVIKRIYLKRCRRRSERPRSLSASGPIFYFLPFFEGGKEEQVTGGGAVAITALNKAILRAGLKKNRPGRLLAGETLAGGGAYLGGHHGNPASVFSTP